LSQESLAADASAPPGAGARAADPLAPLMARLAAGGDGEALKALYSATAPKLLGVCVRILSDRQESEDVLQEVYMTAWRRAGAFDPARAGAMAWLSTIARNRAIDRLRSRAARAAEALPEGLDPPDPAPSAEAELERSDEYARLAACLDKLQPEQAQAIRTAFLEGVTYEALAQRAGVPLGTMKSWVRRGLLRLRECLSA
jgi:RNA polymerase sigma factor (sigma-70 family)